MFATKENYSFYEILRTANIVFALYIYLCTRKRNKLSLTYKIIYYEYN